MLKIGKVLCSAVLSIVVTGASAANLYVEGTNPAQMYEVVKPVVGDTVTPIFLFGDNPQELLAHLDPEAVRKAGVEQATFDYYASKVRPESLAYGVVGYAMGGNVVPGNESINKTCAIVMATHEQMRTTSTMFHEAVHCKNFSELRSDRDAWQLAVSMNRPALGMTNQQFLSLFHEVLAAYVQVAYSANQGVVDGVGMVMRAAKPDKNTATSIGYRTARHALKMCSTKDACSTYAPDIVRMLSSNSYARGQVMLDLKELFAAATASGYVVEHK
ncbi:MULTISPECIES: hypothetical protein [Pseudomonas]|uniref:Lipoprotein n=1 Tax=Pseudomonas putida TaxID=303 RepID=A0A7V8J1Q0_PSEPU|nr:MULTISPECIES: hypothetical protein [Pseudomonas]KAF0252003.1 hypothetical protein GN299_25520 [Pseudomonas putida]MCK2124679.1 hypothetical protein [Pseudomonas sp. PNPG3]